MLRDLLLHGLGPGRLAAGLRASCHAAIARGFADSRQASTAYLQTLTAYFFPTVTTQIANVLCKRSWKSSLFSRNFLNPLHRREALEAIAHWRPPRYTHRVQIDYHVKGATEFDVVRAFFALTGSLLLLPFRLIWMALAQLLVLLERPFIMPSTAWLARFLERHYVIFNFISNPLIDLGHPVRASALLFVFLHAVVQDLLLCPGALACLSLRFSRHDPAHRFRRSKKILPPERLLRWSFWANRQRTPRPPSPLPPRIEDCQ